MLASDLMYIRMRSMHDGTSHYAMSLVTYVALRRSANMNHYMILQQLGISNQRFSNWSKACFGKGIAEVARLLLRGQPVFVLPDCPDEAAARAIAFIQGKKS